jgi:hypothetical protein
LVSATSVDGVVGVVGILISTSTSTAPCHYYLGYKSIIV